MKKTIIILAAALTMGVQANAQSFLDNLKSAASQVIGNTVSNTVSNATGSSTAGSVVNSLLGNIIGTSTVSATSLNGTWNYKQPAVAFQSDNLLTKAGGDVVAEKIETKAQTYLNKIGIKSGVSSLTFSDGKNFSMKVGSRTITGTYTMSGSTITMNFLQGYKQVTGNVNLSGNQMQLTFNANKLLQVLKSVGAKSTNTTITTLTTIAKSYSGMQLGFEYSK